MVAAEVDLRPATPGHRTALARMLGDITLFSAEERAVALEVFDASLGAAQQDYTSLAAETDGALVGWVCWGPTPCTVGTFDMYWIAVDPSVHGAGVGSRLVEEMERRLAGLARMIVVETGGRKEYQPTRTFYLARGYEIVARVPDFYAPGDDQVVFVKKL